MGLFLTIQALPSLADAGQVFLLMSLVMVVMVVMVLSRAVVEPAVVVQVVADDGKTNRLNVEGIKCISV